MLLAALSAILIMTIAWAITVWTSSNDVPMSKHGWIALGLGTVFSLVIGCGLMALMFFSSRSGHDEAANSKVHAAPGERRIRSGPVIEGRANPRLNIFVTVGVAALIGLARSLCATLATSLVRA